MQLKVYSIRDSKGQMYNTPFYFHQHGQAERFVKQNLENPESMLSRYPEDFDLYYLGDFDDATGKIEALDTPQHLYKAVDLKTATT